MPSPPLSTPPGPLGLPLGDALLYLVGAVAVALLGLFGVLFTGRAPLQQALNDAFRSLTEELQQERAQLIARISELEAEKLDRDLTVLQKDGEIRGLKQYRDSLLALIRRSGIGVPGGE